MDFSFSLFFSSGQVLFIFHSLLIHYFHILRELWAQLVFFSFNLWRVYDEVTWHGEKGFLSFQFFSSLFLFSSEASNIKFAAVYMQYALCTLCSVYVLNISFWLSRLLLDENFLICSLLPFHFWKCCEVKFVVRNFVWHQLTIWDLALHFKHEMQF